MKKVYSIFLALFVVLAATAFVQSLNSNSPRNSLVTNALQQRGINSSEIKSINQVNFKNLPNEVNINNIDKTNLALYQVNISGKGPVYVITASDQLFKNVIKRYSQKMFLTYGFSGELASSSYLNTAAGVPTSLTQGYTMPREGSITALTTNLNIISKQSTKPIEIIIYKNGKEFGFRNTFNSNQTGAQSDYDTVSKKTINFNKGDVLSIKVIVPTNTKVQDITTLLEVQTN